MSENVLDSVKSFFESIFEEEPTKSVLEEERTPVELSRSFTLGNDFDSESPLLKEIFEKDLRGFDTPLKLMHYYSEILNEKTSGGMIGKKLDALFLAGKTPESLEGFYHGITISLRTGLDSFGKLNEIRNKFNLGKKLDPMQIIYGRLLSDRSPWAGKNFKKLTSEQIAKYTDGFDKGEETTYYRHQLFQEGQ